jgi:diguanylate cyclase (GGDEF)-like protein/PAS domain S-box-containing protein
MTGGVGHAPRAVDRLGANRSVEIPPDKYRLAFERNPQPMWLCDLDTHAFIAVNDAAIEHYGYSRAEFMTMTTEDIRATGEPSAPGEDGDPDLESAGTRRHRKRDGTIIDVEIVAHELTLGGCRAQVALVNDVTARRTADSAQRAQLVVAQRLAESTSVDEAVPKVLEALGTTIGWSAAAIWRLDEAGGLLRLGAFWAPPTSNGATQKLQRTLNDATFGRGIGWVGQAWATGEPVHATRHRAEDDDADGAVAAPPSASVHRAIAVPIPSDDDVLGVLEFFSPSEWEIDDHILRTLTIASAQLGQFVERKRAEQELAYQALHDPLTKLPNRVLFVDRLKLALATSRRRRSSLAVLFLDIDDFKVLNDSLGHNAGDELLSTLATRIGAAVRPGDTVARFGGDEFVVIVDQIAGTADAVAIAAIFADPFALELGEHFVTASMGIAISQGERQDAQDLIRDADAAMNRAKERGRGQYEVFNELMHAQLLGRLRTENELREALRRDELTLYYQPVVELPTGDVLGLEALVRWNHPERGMLAPAEFIALAEESGLILPMGRWVLTEACRQAAEWQRTRPDLPPITVSVNVSAMQTRHGSLDRVVDDAMRSTGLDPGTIKLELTESVLMEDVDGLDQTLSNLNAQGVQLVLDDFGTGYSALGYLHRFPIEALKIDRSFVAGIGRDARRSAIVQAVIDMARALDIEVVAEGVETAAQARLLFDLGCRYAQGYYFARPAPADEVVEMLDKGALPVPGYERRRNGNGNGGRRPAPPRQRMRVVPGPDSP